MPSFHTVQLALPAFVLVFAIIKLYYAFTGPLSTLPGPAISRFTNLRLKYAVLTGERVRYVHSLHERYGPIVRISPQEVSLCDTNAAKMIYKVGGPFRKSPWYNAFAGGIKEKSLFQELDPYKHGQHRKLTSFNFSEKWVKQMEPFIVKNVQLAVHRMDDETKEKGWCDVFKWFTFMATDVIGEASFGESFRMLETGKKDQYIDDLEKVGKRAAIRVELPLFARLASYLPFGPAKDITGVLKRMERYSRESIERYWRQLRADPENTKPTLLTKEYARVEDGTLTQGQLVRDGVGAIIAGTDTTALAATYAVWMLAHHPEAEAALIHEVSALPQEFTDEDLVSLKVLENVINETLRLRSPVSQSLPRVVPPGGAEFCGHFVPEGTVVGLQAWTMHRDPSVWAAPDVFNPSRWNEPTKAMRDCFVPFGGGSRICIGMHFAQLELRHALANFYRNFEGGVKPAFVEGFAEDDMTPMSYFLLPPKGKKCYVARRK